MSDSLCCALTALRKARLTGYASACFRMLAVLFLIDGLQMLMRSDFNRVDLALGEEVAEYNDPQGAGSCCVMNPARRLFRRPKRFRNPKRASPAEILSPMLSFCPIFSLAPTERPGAKKRKPTAQIALAPLMREAGLNFPFCRITVIFLSIIGHSRCTKKQSKKYHKKNRRIFQ